MLRECPGQESKPKTIGGILSVGGEGGFARYPDKYPSARISLTGLHECQEAQRRESLTASQDMLRRVLDRVFARFVADQNDRWI